jgi:hypothetical protein
MFHKPMVTRRAAKRCGCTFDYVSHPSGRSYVEYLKLGATVRGTLKDWPPRDLIDIHTSLVFSRNLLPAFPFSLCLPARASPRTHASWRKDF